MKIYVWKCQEIGSKLTPGTQPLGVDDLGSVVNISAFVTYSPYNTERPSIDKQTIKV